MRPRSVLHSHTSFMVRAVIRKMVTYLALKNMFPQLLLGHILLLLSYLGQFVPGSTVLLVESKCEGAPTHLGGVRASEYRFLINVHPPCG